MVDDNSPSEIELIRFGPEALYRWLYDNWDNRDRFSQASKQSIQLLSGQFSLGNDELKKLATSFAYESLIQALQEEDFGWFVDSVIAGAFNTSNRDNLEYSLFELRLELSRAFKQERLWPSQGFTQILSEAIKSAVRAKERLPQINVAVNDFQRQHALQSIHEGIDRALICAERFLALLLEFLARTGLKAGASTQAEADVWLNHAGILPSQGSEPSDWGDKEKHLSVAADNFLNFLNRSISQGVDVFSSLDKFAVECRGGFKRSKDFGKTEQDTSTGPGPKKSKPPEERPSFDEKMPIGNLWSYFRKLRDVRNNVRHSSHSLISLNSVPESYQQSSEQVFNLLTALRRDFWENHLTPAVVKIISYNRDCFGGIELQMAMEGERLITSRFLNQDALEAFGTLSSQASLMSNPAAEFFVFPSASPDQTQIFNPLLIEREEISKKKPFIKLSMVVPVIEIKGKEEASLLPFSDDKSASEETAKEQPIEEPIPTHLLEEPPQMKGNTMDKLDPTGRSFLSYRRARSTEAALLIAAQRDRGIPTWQDIHNLDEKPLEEELRRVLNDPDTANAILLLTPEVASSEVIQRIEAPLIIERAKRGTGFFVVPVLAGGLDFADADKVIDPVFAMEDLRRWSLFKAAKDPLDAAEAARIAQRVLQRRLATIHLALPKDEPLRLNLSTRRRQAWQSGSALLMDWTERFNGREATAEMWRETLLPALEDVAATVEQYATGRVVEANGLLSLPAATALGCTFLATRRLPIAWRQYTPGRAEQIWSLDAVREQSGFQGVTTGDNTGSDEHALLVMINDNNVEKAFFASRHTLPKLRAITKVSNSSGIRHDLATPGLAADVAFVTAEAIRKARQDYPPFRKLHLFMSVPAGVAMMIGQLLNTVGEVQTYEHIAEENIYHPAALLHPAD